MVHLLIPYVPILDHLDPLFDEFTYGDVSSRARKLKHDLHKGDYVFFHTTSRDRHYITAYYLVDRVLDSKDVSEDRLLRQKYRSPHIKALGISKRRGEDAILFGDPITSRKLPQPLPFGRTLADKLSLGVSFPENRSELSSISWATRAWRELTTGDVKVLLEEIEKLEKAAVDSELLLSTDEIQELREADLEDMVIRNSTMLGEDLTFVRRQYEISPTGRIDLLFSEGNGEYVIVELKIGSIGRDVANQIRRYMHEVKSSEGKGVRGIVICKDVLPAFRELYRKMKDVQVFYYGWKASLQPSRLELD
jgi:hypothetical protein